MGGKVCVLHAKKERGGGGNGGDEVYIEKDCSGCAVENSLVGMQDGRRGKQCTQEASAETSVRGSDDLT